MADGGLGADSMADLNELVRRENERQLAKWGYQARTPSEWMLFLTEEVGELADAIGEHSYRGGSKGHVVEEAIQVATLALKVAEMFGAGDA